MLHHRWPWTTRFLDYTGWFLYHGHASHATSTQGKGLRQSPGELPGPETPCAGLSSVLLCGGGERSVLQALQEPGLCWRSFIQGFLVGLQLLRISVVCFFFVFSNCFESFQLFHIWIKLGFRYSHQWVYIWQRIAFIEGKWSTAMWITPISGIQASRGSVGEDTLYDGMSEIDIAPCIHKIPKLV